MKAERNRQPCRIFRYTTSIALMSFVSSQSIAPAFAQTVTPSPSPSPTMSQAQQLQEAVTALGNAKTAAMVSEGAWGAVTALCGYNCFNFVSGMVISRHSIVTEATTVNTQISALATSCAAAYPSLKAQMAKVNTAYAQIDATNAQSNTAAGAGSAAKSANQVPTSFLTPSEGGIKAPYSLACMASEAISGLGDILINRALAQQVFNGVASMPNLGAAPAAPGTINFGNTFSSNAGMTAGNVPNFSAPTNMAPATSVVQPTATTPAFNTPYTQGPPQAQQLDTPTTTTGAAPQAAPATPQQAAGNTPNPAGASASAEQFTIAVHAFAEDILTTVATPPQTATAVQAANAATCGPQLAQLGGLAKELNDSATAYDASVQSVKSVGNYFAIAGAVVSVADMGYSMYQSSQADKSNPYESQLSGNTTQQVVGLVGVAATSAYGLFNELNHADGIADSAPSHTANALGISSCAAAGFGIFEVAEKNSDRESITSSASEDQQQLNNLNSATPTPMPTTSWNTIRQFQKFLVSLEIAEKIGKWIPDPLGTCAYASTGLGESGLSVCSSARDSQSSFLACAKAGDPLLAQAFNRMGGEDRFFSVLEQNLGINRSTFLSVDHAPSMEQIVGIMTSRAPQYRVGMNSIASGVQAQLAAHHGTSGQHLQAQPLQAPRQDEVGLIQPTALTEGSMVADVNQPQAVAMRAPASAPSLVDNESGDLFSRVSMRYQADRDRVVQLDWSTPYNRFSTRR
jgi:hypothetical protein